MRCIRATKHNIYLCHVHSVRASSNLLSILSPILRSRYRSLALVSCFHVSPSQFFALAFTAMRSRGRNYCVSHACRYIYPCVPRAPCYCSVTSNTVSATNLSEDHARNLPSILTAQGCRTVHNSIPRSTAEHPDDQHACPTQLHCIDPPLLAEVLRVTRRWKIWRWAVVSSPFWKMRLAPMGVPSGTRIYRSRWHQKNKRKYDAVPTLDIPNDKNIRFWNVWEMWNALTSANAEMRGPFMTRVRARQPRKTCTNRLLSKCSLTECFRFFSSFPSGPGSKVKVPSMCRLVRRCKKALGKRVSQRSDHI